MRVFKTCNFTRFARREEISDHQLAAAIRQAETGLIDANLGGGLIKLRISRQGSGKRGGYRTIIAYQSGSLAFFLFGFAKNEQENISKYQLELLKDAAKDMLARNEDVLNNEVEKGELQEVAYEA